jgi:hypothetical protein
MNELKIGIVLRLDGPARARIGPEMGKIPPWAATS